MPADTIYTLSETKAPSGFTNGYFAELFAAKYSTYADLVNLVNGKGYRISYTTKDVEGERLIEDKDYIFRSGFGIFFLISFKVTLTLRVFCILILYTSNWKASMEVLIIFAYLI